jgi:hypothetical protein
MRMSKVALCVLAMLIVVSFFLPWVVLESGVVGGVTKILTGERKAALQSISGFQVPVLANSAESRLTISVIELFNPGIKNADKKSYLIWVVPLLAVLICASFLFFGKNKWVSLICGIVGMAVFAVAVFKIKTTNLDKLVVKVAIGYGLWLVLYAYLGMGVVSLANFFALKKK